MPTTAKRAVSKTQITGSVAIAIVSTVLAVWLLGSRLGSMVTSFRTPSQVSPLNSSSSDLACEDQNYKTEIISLDPLVMYIHNFFNKKDIDKMIEAGEDRFNPSVVNQNGRMIQNPYRTSWSAALPDEDPAVQCVLERSKRFLGTILNPDEDEMGVPQLVRYSEGQEYNLHHDWMRIPQAAFDGSPRSFNRVASFFVILQANCTGGETWFPFIKPVAPQPNEREESRLWREHEDGGLAFKPVPGNGIFWVNLFPNGTGDTRTVHAGLPVTSGSKTAMNIWPRQYRPNPQ
ncbi:hypothetical protein F5Y14DRAFT_449741 [Nemania sp. NC0429]|nr:hypothetical protein F5Y14DRAFT_449741 [Nemania sp. NC0429]